jgi:hypothetical protein
MFFEFYLVLNNGSWKLLQLCCAGVYGYRLNGCKAISIPVITDASVLALGRAGRLE